jgi:hypothetical protein
MNKKGARDPDAVFPFDDRPNFRRGLERAGAMSAQEFIRRARGAPLVTKNH